MAAKKHVFWKAVIGLFALAILLCVAGCGDDDSESEVQTTQTKRTGTIYFVPNCVDGVERKVVTQQFEFMGSDNAVRVKLQKNPFTSEYFTFKHWSKYASYYANTRETVIADEAEETLTFDAYFDSNYYGGYGNRNFYGIVLYAEWEPIVIELTVDMADMESFSFDNKIKLCSLTVTGKYDSLSIQYLKSWLKINQYDRKISLDLSAVTGEDINNLNFSDILSLVSVVMPSEATALADNAFSGCTNLESITIGDTLTSIGDCAFYNCSSLKTITIPDSVTTIEKNAFSSSGLVSVNVGTGLTTLPSFDNCSSLETITIAESNAAYKSSDGIVYSKDGTSLVFCPRGKTGAVTVDSVCTAIENSAFSDCTKMTAVTIGEHVQTIGSYAFQNCTGLRTILFPASVTQIGQYAFKGCYLWSAYFAETKGWTFTLTDAERNAEYLCNMYSNYTWKRTE